LPLDAYDALVRIHAGSDGEEAKAFAYFDQLVRLPGAKGPSQATLVAMISSCVEARNATLAEHIFSWACEAKQCTLPVFSATLKVLAASQQPERICAIYDMVSSNKELSFDDALLEQIAECATEVGRSDLAKSLTKATKKPTSTQSPINQMRACASEGNTEQVMTLLKELQDDGEVDTVTYNCALDTCVSHGDASAAKLVLKDMQTSGNLDVASYNILLKQCLSTGASPQVAQGVLAEMRQRGLEPNTATYNSLLSCAITVGDFTGVWKTIDDLEKSGQAADIYTLSIIFKGYRRDRRNLDSPSINRALMLIKSHGVKIDENLVNVALEACLTLRDLGCLRNALTTIWSSGWTVPKLASQHTYGVIIKAYGQIQSLTEVWQLWSELTVTKGMEANEQLYGQMLDVLVGKQSFGRCSDIVQGDEGYPQELPQFAGLRCCLCHDHPWLCAAKGLHKGARVLR